MKSEKQKLEERYQEHTIRKYLNIKKARELEGKFVDHLDIWQYESGSPKDMVKNYKPGTIVGIVGNFGPHSHGYETLFYTKAIYEEALNKSLIPKIINLFHDNEYQEMNKSYLEEGIPAKDIIQFKREAYGVRHFEPLFEDWSSWKKYEDRIKGCFKSRKVPLSHIIDVGLAIEFGDNLQK